MGRLEKIVVLTVLFLVAVILAVSLNRDEVVAGPQTPELALAGPVGAAQGEPRETVRRETYQAPPKVLSGTLEDPPETAKPETKEPVTPVVTPPPAQVEKPAVEPAPKPAEPKPLLRTREGLEASLVPELMLYTWKAGDSFTAIADRYYGSRLEVGKLRAANEGREESAIAAGEKVFVPVEAPAASERLGRSTEQAGQWQGGVYTVESGDMLGKIAQKTYGTASQWRRIYDANRDVLSSPDALTVGMRLRIPAQ